MNKHGIFAEKCPILEEIVNKVIESVHLDINIVTAAEYMTGYTCSKCAKEYYEKYDTTLKNYIYSKVFPQLAEKKGEIFLKELLQQWNKYKTLHKRLFKMFQWLDRCYIKLNHFPSLVVKSHLIFNNTVLGRINDFQVRDALVSEINRERNGEEIDHALMKNAVKIYLEIDNHVKNAMRYEWEFEREMLKETAHFYSRKGLEWFRLTSSASNPDAAYIQKIREAFEEEERRVSNYMDNRSLGRLLKVVEYQLLKVQNRQERMRKQNDDDDTK